ncbi:MAG: polysaccharide biosynthesis/export family protein [Pyrinomonadaceae bacterium]
MNDLRLILIATIFVIGASAVVRTQTVDPPPSGTPTETSFAGMADDKDRYRIGLRDVLDIHVFRHPDLSQRAPVSSTGTITLFRLDAPIVAVCKSEMELAAEISAAYKKKFIKDPEVTVVVADQKSQAVGVMGAVTTPGYYYVNRRVHLLEILAQAGGPNKESGTRLIVARTGSISNCKQSADNDHDVSVIGFKIRDVQEGKETFWMEPGDIVSVLDADVVYIYGNVHQQGAIRIRENITLTQAIVSAEGLKPAAKKDKVRILRQKAGSLDREELVFDLNQIDKGKIPDPFLEPNDIVAVSEDRTKAIIQGFANAIKTSLPSAVYRIPVP